MLHHIASRGFRHGNQETTTHKLFPEKKNVVTSTLTVWASLSRKESSQFKRYLVYVSDFREQTSEEIIYATFKRLFISSCSKPLKS